MHTLWVVLLITRNKEVSNAIIGVVKLRLPFKIPLKYSGLGGGWFGEVPQEGTLGIIIIPNQKSARLPIMLRYPGPVLQKDRS